MTTEQQLRERVRQMRAEVLADADRLVSERITAIGKRLAEIRAEIRAEQRG